MSSVHLQNQLSHTHTRAHTYGFREEGLAAAGRAVEEYPLGRAHAEAPELLRELDGVLDRLPQLALRRPKAHDIKTRNMCTSENSTTSKKKGRK